MSNRSGKLLRKECRSPDYRPEPSASVIRQRPQLAPGVGTSFGTDENLDAQAAWLAHIEAGRISVE